MVELSLNQSRETVSITHQDQCEKTLIQVIEAVNGTREPTRKPLAVYWAGNAGTCESIANSVVKAASLHGYAAEIGDLDTAAHGLPKDKPVLIITSSYEGNPPDNAKHFADYLESLNGPKELQGVQYAVFGCGNRKR